MKRWIGRVAPFLFAAALTSALAARAQDNLNARAVDDLKAYVQNSEEGDTLFNQKKYAEAAAALAAAHGLYQRAEKRDENAERFKISLKAGSFPSLRHYGYGMGANASLTENVTGAVEGSAAGLHKAVTEMWMDAAILGDLDKGPLAGAFDDPPMVELTEEQLSSIIASLYGPVSVYDLPVKDDEWQDVVLQSRRAQLIVEHALQKNPGWLTAKHGRSRNNNKLEPTGAEALPG